MTEDTTLTDSAKVAGAPVAPGTMAPEELDALTDSIIAALKTVYDPEIPADIYEQWDAKTDGQVVEREWNERLAAYRAAYPELAAEFERRMAGDLPANWAADSAKFIADLQANPAKIATRKASQNALDAFGALLPELLGGSADLAPSNLTFHKSSKSVTPQEIRAVLESAGFENINTYTKEGTTWLCAIAQKPKDDEN